MSSVRIGVIVGSNSQQSINRKLAQGLMKLGAAQADWTLIDISGLPLYNRDFDGTPDFQPFEAFKAEVSRVDGVLFVTPEYNRSIPAVLKNALDAGSRPYGQAVWNGKPAGVIGTSPGGAATSMAQQHLRNILANQNMPTMGQPEGFIRWSDTLVDEQGNIDAESQKFLGNYVSKLVEWVQLHSKA